MNKKSEQDRQRRKFEVIEMIVKIVVSAAASVLTVLILHQLGWLA